MEIPATRYAKSGEVNIAYQVVGEGPFDLVWVPGSFSHVDLTWEDPPRARFFEQIASYCRLIMFDKRGTGASDRVFGIADLETRMDDVRAVMDAVGTDSVALCGVSEGGPMSVLFAATYPERVWALVLYGTQPRFTRSPQFPFGLTREEYLRELEHDIALWGTEELVLEGEAMQEADPERARQQARWMRQSASPGAVETLERMNLEIDVCSVLPNVRVPTLVLHRTEDGLPIEGARWMAERIPGARFGELPGHQHFPFLGDSTSVLSEIQAFVTDLHELGSPEREPDRVLATVLFTDIVGSTKKAVELGDARWRELLQDHHALIRRQLTRFRGRELDTAGDGSSRASTDRPEEFGAPRRSPSRSRSSDWTSGLGCTPGSASS